MTHRILIGPALLLALALLPAFGRGDDSYVQHENVVYAEEHGVGLLMDVFVPKGEKNGRGIIDVVSGSYYSDRGKLREHQQAQVYQIMCGKGFTVFAIRPGSITKFCIPEMLKHINAGIRWVKEHAKEYGIDPTQLGLTGASAGGHLATLAMVTADDATRVKAVAVFFPATDFMDWNGKPMDRSADGSVSKRALSFAYPPGQGEGKKLDEVGEALKALSPARLVKPDLPPYLTIHGDADTTVPLQQSQKMVAELKAKGNSAELIVKPGGGHPWLTIPEEVVVLTDWLAKHLISK